MLPPPSGHTGGVVEEAGRRPGSLRSEGPGEAYKKGPSIPWRPGACERIDCRMKGGPAARIGFIVAAVMVSLRAVLDPFEPRYWDPQSVLDYLAVVGMTAMLLGLSVAFAVLAIGMRRSGLRAAPVALVAAAVGSATAGISNFLEDGLRWMAFGWGFVFGILLLAISLVVAGVATLITRRAWMLGVCLILLAVAFYLSFSGAAGGIALAACCLAAAFLSVRPALGGRSIRACRKSMAMTEQDVEVVHGPQARTICRS